MDYLQGFEKQFRYRLTFLILISSVILIGAWYLIHNYFLAPEWEQGVCISVIAVLLAVILPILSSKSLTSPLRLIWQAVLHIAPETQKETPAPDLNSAHFGKELVTSLTSHIYQFATVADTVASQLRQQGTDLGQNFVAVNLPLPLMVLSPERKIVYANNAAGTYLGVKPADIVNRDAYSVLDMSFQNESTFDVWLETSKQSSVTAAKTWENVKLVVPPDNRTLQFDLAAYYNKNNSMGWEVMLILFDHTGRYSSDDQAMSMVAMAVHELRTPLTLLRGYIEALGDDLTGKLPSVDAEYLHKMDAAGQQLVTFINNVLNVARITDDQFLVRLHEEAWPAVLETAVADMKLRAMVHGITLETTAGKDLPTVGVDRSGMYEVICNLIDNAIKYSGNGKKIVVRSTLTEDGLVQTDVQDFGIGIPSSVVANLFDKYYRSHRSRDRHFAHC